MDSDLSYIPEEWIKELTMKLMNGYDAAFTRRIPRFILTTTPRES